MATFSRVEASEIEGPEFDSDWLISSEKISLFIKQSSTYDLEGMQ